MLQAYAARLRLFSREARLFLAANLCFAAFAAVQNVLANLYWDGLGFDRAFIGTMSSIGQVAGGLAAFPAALLLDRVGRRRGVIGGVLIGTLGWTLALTSRLPAAMLIGQALTGAGSVLYGLAVVPLLAEASTPAERTELFSVGEGLSRLALFFSSLLAGAAPAAAVALTGLPPGSAAVYQAVLLASLLLRLAGLIPLGLMHDRRRGRGSGRAMPAASYFDPRVLLRLRTPVFRCALPLLIVYAGGALVNPFLGLLLRERFGAGDLAIGAILGSIDLVTGLAALIAPLAARRFGRGRAVAWAALLSAAGFGVIGFGASLGAVAATIVLRSAVFNSTLPLYRALVIDSAPDDEVAVVNFVLTTSTNIGPAIAPAASGWVQDRAGFSPLFVAAIGAYAAAAALFRWAARRLPA